MFAPLRSCSLIVTRSHGVLAINKNNLIVQSVTQNGSRNYAKGDKDCCKDIAQTEGRNIDSWPKYDAPPPGWRYECPQETQPPNYDPYRIKVPDIVVPPMPPSNAKWTGIALTTGHHGHQNQGYPAGPGTYDQQQANTEQQDQATEEESKDESFLGILKSWFGRGKSKEGKGGSDAMMEDLRYEEHQLPINSDCHLGDATGQKNTDLFYNSPIMHPDYWKPKPTQKTEEIRENIPRLGYHGKSKYKYAFHEPWKPLDRMTLLERAEKEEMDQGGVITRSSDEQMTS